SATATTTTSSTASAVTTPGPTMSGTAADCNLYHLATAGDTCSSIETAYGITSDEFLEWNPAISSDCSSNFWIDEAYCVGVTSSSSSVTATATISSTASVVTAPGPTLSGTASNCNAYYVVQSGDSCYSVETAYGISADEFFEWNPSVSFDCSTNFWADEAYCVGVSS
ncbi:hypothetical protein BKA67DRAFT_526685, partial [Truncatella angustata]